MAISHALSVLSWMEMPEDDQPPESIWLNSKALNEHFERLTARHRSSSRGMEPVEEVPMMDNELTASLRR